MQEIERCQLILDKIGEKMCIFGQIMLFQRHMHYEYHDFSGVSFSKIHIYSTKMVHIMSGMKSEIWVFAIRDRYTWNQDKPC